VFLMHDSTDAPINGTGRWALEQGTAYWKIKLNFDDIPGFPSGTQLEVIVSGSGKSTGLYQWAGEEGGARYELTRK
jgi:hypothetical protein